MSIRNKVPALTVSPGFLLMAGLMLYLDDGTGILGWGILAALIHELGHILAAGMFGGRVEALSLSAAGAELRFEYGKILSYGRENLIVLAGPMANFLLGLPAMLAGAYLPAIVSLGLGAFNLLPVLPLDGGRMLSNLLSERFGPDLAERVSAVLAGVLIGILTGLGAIAAIKFANFMLLVLSLWLLWGTAGKKNRNSQK